MVCACAACNDEDSTGLCTRPAHQIGSALDWEPVCSYAPASLFAGFRHEAHFPTQPTKACAHPRFPCPHENARWSQGHQCTPCQRSASSEPLIAARINAASINATSIVGVASLPPAARLRSAADFVPLKSARARIDGKFFRIRYVQGATNVARLGMAVSRKVSKRAVVRNRIKRCLRESFRQHRALLPAVDLLVIPRSEAASVAGSVLREEIDRLWMRVKPLHPNAEANTIAR